MTAAGYGQFEAVNMKTLGNKKKSDTELGTGAGCPCLVKSVGQQSHKIVFLKTGAPVTWADEGAWGLWVDTLLQPDDGIM